MTSPKLTHFQLSNIFLNSTSRSTYVTSSSYDGLSHQYQGLMDLMGLVGLMGFMGLAVTYCFSY